MDRRSWLWRRKSSSSFSEKNIYPPETDSSGSFSSLSERFSDEQLQGYPHHNPQSPEVVASKPIDNLEEIIIGSDDTVKTLTDKLSAALLNLRDKEELVKQHAKVAEEAVCGWESAEKEASSLKIQLETANKKNTALEDRVGHVDAALKECVRQLRQGRDEQEKRINEALAKKACEWESQKSELETQLVELKNQVEAVKSEDSVSVDSDFRQKLEAAEKEISSLKVELLSRTQELKIRTLERDLTTRAAETASKLHLESIKKIAKLEAECRRLKSVARKASTAHDLKSLAASSVYVESFTDSHSDSGERLLTFESDAHKLSSLDSWTSGLVAGLDQSKDRMDTGTNVTVPSVEINLMDDFLEMERFAALPDRESGGSYLQTAPVSDEVNSIDNPWKAELESLIQRTGELEEKLERMQEEKFASEIALNKSQMEVEMLRSQLKEADEKLLEVQVQLTIVNKSNQARVKEIKGIEAKAEMTESQLRIAKAEIKTLLSQVDSLNLEAENERSLSAELFSKSQKLEDALATIANESNQARAKEIMEIEAKAEATESQLRIAKAEIKALLSRVELLNVEAEKERSLSAGFFSKCQKLEEDLATITNESNQARGNGIQGIEAKAEATESELRIAKDEIKTLLSQVESLSVEAKKERSLSEEFLSKCEKLEDELAKSKHESELQKQAKLRHAATLNGEMKKKQEKELAVASRKFAECQKTISSIGHQLNSLMTWDHLLLDSEKSPSLTDEEVQSIINAGEQRRSLPGNSYSSTAVS